jgi:hypothetical protein
VPHWQESHYSLGVASSSFTPLRMGTKSLQSTCGSQFAEHVLLGRDGFADEEINGICTLLRGQPLEQR